MTNSRKTQLLNASLASLGVSLMLLSAPGCGSEDPVPAAEVTCTPGKQEPCTCSDGRSGNQTCDGAGRSFSACECGGAGGSGGTAGGGGTGASGGSAGAGGVGGSAGASGGSGASGTSGGAAGSGAGGSSGSGGTSTAGAGGANCPDNLVADCSGECLEPDAKCPVGCSQPSSISVSGDLPLLVRLPAPSDPSDCCAPIKQIVGVRYTDLGSVRFSVSPPWRIIGYEDGGVTNGQYCAHNSLQCVVRNPLANTAIVFTDDPNAPVADVLLEAASSCP